MYNATIGYDHDYPMYNATIGYDYQMYNVTEGYGYPMYNATDGYDRDYSMHNATVGYDYPRHNATDLYNHEYPMYNATVGYDYPMQNATDGYDHDNPMHNATVGYDYLMHNATEGYDQDYPMYNATDGSDYDNNNDYTYDYKDDYFKNFMEDYFENNRGVSKKNYFDVDGDDCASFYTCNSSSSYRTCYCDKMCEAYNDCCFDAGYSVGSSTPTDKQKELIGYMSCKALPDIYTDWYMFIIDSCPSESNVYIKHLCSNVDVDDIYSRTPASGKESGMIYKNMFCAICHGEDFLLWLPEIYCEWGMSYTGNYTTETLLNLEECRLSFVPNDSSVEIRICYPMVSGCSPESDYRTLSNVTNKCESAQNKIVFTLDKVYKNKYCYECDIQKASNASCSRSDYNVTFPGGSRGLFMYSYRILFNLEDRKAKSTKDHLFFPSEEEEYNLESNCTIDQVFDPLAKSCKTILCAINKIIRNGKCLTRQMNRSMNSRNQFCRSISFNETDYIKHNETSITLLHSNETYHNIRIENSTAFVCLKIRTSVQKIKTLGNFLEGILSLTCSSTSILFLIITIFIYSFRRMLNMAGKILICLSFSLCMAQFLFIFASLAEHIPTLCMVIAVCIHYFYLSSFTWMNVMSFDVHNTFTTLLKISKDNAKRFKFYSLYAWMIPLVIVCSGFIIDQVTSTAWRPAYGSTVCWISNPNGLIAFFLIPVATLVFSNIVMYIRTSWIIFSGKRSSMKIFNKRDKCEILIYIKLSTVMGLTWVFAYVALIFKEDVLWYVFIILNGSQGLNNDIFVLRFKEKSAFDVV